MSLRQETVNPQVTNFSGTWAGLSHGADFYFHHAVFELIDNSYSYCIDPPGSSRPRNPTIEIILEDLGLAGITFCINDNGCGISYEIYKDVLMNIGSRPAEPSLLSEHGFGLKNALSYIQSGQLKEFEIISKHGDETWKLIGPYGLSMRFEEVPESYWNEKVQTDRLRSNRENGTTITTTISSEVLKTVVRGSSRGRNFSQFDQFCDILREHIMMTYRKILDQHQNLRIFVISKKQEGNYYYGNSLYLRDDNSIKKWSHVYERTHWSEHELHIRLKDESEYTIHMEIGRAPRDSKDTGENYHGLKHYYNLTSARVGIDIFVRNRLIRTRIWGDIWPEAPTFSYNWFIGELELTADFPTRNNKTNVDHSTEIWQAIVQKIIIEGIVPPKKEHGDVHPDVLRRVINRIASGAYRVVGGQDNVKIEETTVFGSSEIDIWFEVEQTGAANIIHIYEVKVETSSPVDLYQLLMYCDGFIRDGHAPISNFIQLHLVAPRHSQGTKECCDFLRTRPTGRNATETYDVWLDKLNISYEADGKTIKDVSIVSQWYPPSP